MVKNHTSCLKLKRGGKERPFGSRALGSRSSSKKGWAHASNCNMEKTSEKKIRETSKTSGKDCKYKILSGNRF